MAGPKTYYITTPIYYVNDSPHIGHAYTTLACDVLARFKRLDGYRVMFLTGPDEHGQKVEKSAQTAGMGPQSFTDKVSQNFRDLGQVMNYSNDDFIRTTEPRHTRACQAIWARLLEAGDIYLGNYEGWYSVRDEAFYGEGELTKTTDGRRIAPSGAEVEWVKEPSYFFRLSAYGDKLLRMTFNWQDNDQRMSEHVGGQIAAIGKAMGAKSQNGRIVKRGDVWDTRDYQSTHINGGTSMGVDPSTSVVNRYGQSWDCHNLFLCGANLFANGICYNPTGLVGALAYWTAANIRSTYLKAPGAMA
jgi:leucyl-tRNA synthetase